MAGRIASPATPTTSVIAGPKLVIAAADRRAIGWTLAVKARVFSRKVGGHRQQR